MNRKRQIFVFSIIALTLGTTFLISILLLRIPYDKPFKIYNSPGNKYRIEVYGYMSYKNFLPAGSGQGSDCEGFVLLKDNSSSKILQRCDVEMANMAYNPTWAQDHVYMGTVYDWELPH